MCMWELSTETNGIETAVVRYGVATIIATVICDDEIVSTSLCRISFRRFRMETS